MSQFAITILCGIGCMTVGFWIVCAVLILLDRLEITYRRDKDGKD